MRKKKQLADPLHWIGHIPVASQCLECKSILNGVRNKLMINTRILRLVAHFEEQIK